MVSDSNLDVLSPSELEMLLNTYDDVFQKPLGFPPSRSHDYAIRLLPGAGPVNVKPHRYAYFQMQVMDQLVSRMLKEGKIRTSISPFSSPVSLVRK